MGREAMRSLTSSGAGRWVALIVLCLGVFMSALDSTIVNVVLPSIRDDLSFSDPLLVWVVNAYLLTFGGVLLLAGRLGDLYGSTRLFLVGIVLFTLASIACGLAQTRMLLIAARGVQGLGGATISAVVLSMIMRMFPAQADRAKAVGIYGFVSFGGATLGVLLGGLLATALSWRWIFLVNVPVGAIVCVLGPLVVPKVDAAANEGRLDVWGSITITASLMIALYAVSTGDGSGWYSLGSIGLMVCSAGLFAAFLIVESRARTPLIRFSLFKLRNFTVACVACMLWTGSIRTWMLISSLYLHQVLGYSPMDIALVFLPANIIVAVLSVWVSAKLVTSFGIRAPIGTGMLLGALGLGLLSRVSAGGDVVAEVLPSMVLLGLGIGIVFNPLLLAAMSEVAPGETGLASGIMNTAALMGGAVGLAIITSISAARTSHLQTVKDTRLADALAGGYQLAFLMAALVALAAAALATTLIRMRKASAAEIGESRAASRDAS